MQVFILISIVLGVVLSAILFLPGLRYVREGFKSQQGNQGCRECRMTTGAEVPTKSPKVALIVPVSGNTPTMKVSLQSLLNQDYPNYETFFVTRDSEEPATFLIREISKGNNKTQHVIAGQTNKCAQKNQNLIAGITAASPAVEILVFCDSTHLAPPNLISNLIDDIIKGDVDITSGYHRIIPGDTRLASLGMVWTVLAIHMLQGNPFFAQPWGGAMAINRHAFDAHKVYHLWAKSVVDDVSLGAFMRKARIKFKTVSSVCLSTPVSMQTFSKWCSWLTRQLLYLKFCLPWVWLGTAIITYLLISPFILSLMAIVGGGLGKFSGGLVVAGMAFFTLFTCCGVFSKKLAAVEVPLLPALAAFYLTPFIYAWCYLKTWFTKTLTWKGISYRVNFNGEVLYIISES